MLLAQLAKLPVGTNNVGNVGMLQQQLSSQDIALLKARLANMRTDITEPPDPVISDPPTQPVNPVIDGVAPDRMPTNEIITTPITTPPSAIIDGERTPEQDQLQELSNRPLTKEEDYRGQHQAPTREDGYAKPANNLTEIYPEDIYSPNGARYYGDGDTNLDEVSLNVIRRLRSRPNEKVTIYRALPKGDNKKSELNKIVKYHDKFGFFPVGNNIINDLTDKYPIDKHTYNEQQKLIKEDLIKEMDNTQDDKIGINAGDWVTINKQYAKQHMAGEKGWKVVSKTVPAKEIYTDGNSLHEWGYSPEVNKAQTKNKLSNRKVK